MWTDFYVITNDIHTLFCVLCLGCLLYLSTAMSLRLKPLSSIYTQDAINCMAQSGDLQEAHSSQSGVGTSLRKKPVPLSRHIHPQAPPPLGPCDTEGRPKQLDSLKPLWGVVM